ncbi:MAG TPA: hypothetical protein VLK33_10035 [Terriglobales bacterium]|nr:hypothetical protein [Terriglobales bacterium]
MNSEPSRTGTETPLVELHVQEVVRSAEHELNTLLQQRADLMKRIGSVKQTLVGLANMFGDSVLNENLLELLDRGTARRSGFTQACRSVLMESPVELSARQVCDLLQKKFPGVLERHKKPFASVTTVLSRLVAYGETRTHFTEGGGRVWQWVSEGERKDVNFLTKPQAVVGFMADPRNSA